MHTRGVDRTSVLIVDDHRSFAGALAVRLDAEPDLRVVGTATCAREAEDAVRTLQPELAIVDVDLGADNGVELVATLHASHPELRIVVVTCHDDASIVAEAMQAGASAFVLKDLAVDSLIGAIRASCRGDSWLAPRLLGDVLRHVQLGARAREEDERRIARLTTREREVLALLVAGHDRAGIGARLFLSTNTVRTHVQNLLRKLGVHSSIEAVGIALRAGMRPPAAPELPRAASS
jgi:DNA-binding NarL/FixJ family response regulator